MVLLVLLGVVCCLPPTKQVFYVFVFFLSHFVKYFNMGFTSCSSLSLDEVEVSNT